MSDEFDPLTGDPLPKTNKLANGSNSQITAKITDQPDLSRLEEMGREELLGLIQKVSQAGWGYGSLKGADLIQMALKTKDEAYEALKLTALTLAVNAGDWREFNALATFWAEREKGKPAGATTNINIGQGNGEKQLRVIFVNAEDVRREKETKVIDVTPKD